MYSSALLEVLSYEKTSLKKEDYVNNKPITVEQAVAGDEDDEVGDAD